MGPKKKWTGHHAHKRKRDGDAGDGAAGGSGDNGGGGGSNGDQGPKKPRRAAVINLGNVKGHQAVVGTCDIRNDRQATAELVDMLNAVADDMYPEDEKDDEGGEATAGSSLVAANTDTNKSTAEDNSGDGGGDETTASAAAQEPAPAASELSVEEMVRQEAEALRSGSVKTHRFKSVNTTVKGVVMVCVMDPKIDILRLVDALYAEIRTTKMRRSRFLERVTPLQVTSYSDLESLKQAAEPMILAALPPVAEGVPPLPVVVRAGAAKTASKPDGAKPETEEKVPSVEKVETVAEAEVVAAVATATAAAAGTGNEAEVVDGKQQAASPATGNTPGAPGNGNGTPSGAGKQVGAVEGGEAKRTSDKRWRYRVDLRRRNSGLKRMDLINVAAGSVGEGHSVNMSSPEVIVKNFSVFL